MHLARDRACLAAAARSHRTEELAILHLALDVVGSATRAEGCRRRRPQRLARRLRRVPDAEVVARVITWMRRTHQLRQLVERPRRLGLMVAVGQDFRSRPVESADETP